MPRDKPPYKPRPTARRVPPTDLWDRQPGETSKAFEAFRAYLLLGAGRTIPLAAGQVGKSTAHLQAWSTRNHWLDRSVAYDNHLASAADAARNKVRAADAATWEKRKLATLARAFALSETLFAKVEAMLAMPLTTRKTEDGGKTIHIHPARWSIRDAATIAKVALEMAATSTGEALADREDFDPATATPEECKAFCERQEARRKAIKSSMEAE